MSYKTAAIISYCSYHNDFIERVILEALKVNREIVVVSYRDFFDGEQDQFLMDCEALGATNHIILDNDPSQSSRWHHNQGRKLGYEALEGKYDMVFFIDADEVLEGDRVAMWLQTIGIEDYKLAHFWYYRDTCFRADTVEEGAVLVSNETLKSSQMNWFGGREREDYSKKWNYMASYQNKVLGHHYSWAGSQEMLLRKVASWGHNQDGINWKKMVIEEYKHDFNFTCPFKPYTFTEVEPYIGFRFYR